MSFKIDTEKVSDSVKELRALLSKCKEIYDTAIPESTYDKGLSHNSLLRICNNIKETSLRLGELISKSIEFLGETSEMFDTAEENSSVAILEANSSKTDSSAKKSSNKSSQKTDFVFKGDL